MSYFDELVARYKNMQYGYALLTQVAVVTHKTRYPVDQSQPIKGELDV